MRRRYFGLEVSTSAYAFRNFVKSLVQVLDIPRVEAEKRADELLSKLFPRLARSPEIIAQLLNARVRGRPAALGRVPPPSPPAGAAQPPRPRRARAKPPRR